MRFDEVELRSVPLPGVIDTAPSGARPTSPVRAGEVASAPSYRRLLALFTDLSLFVALALALSPLLPTRTDEWAIVGLAGFVVMTSYYYFVGSWLLWGKTIGGAIFDVRVVPAGDAPMSLHAATLRWAGMFVSLLTAGIGFAFAALPARLSLPDRMSGTRCVAAH